MKTDCLLKILMMTKVAFGVWLDFSHLTPFSCARCLWRRGWRCRCWHEWRGGRDRSRSCTAWAPRTAQTRSQNARKRSYQRAKNAQAQEAWTIYLPAQLWQQERCKKKEEKDCKATGNWSSNKKRRTIWNKCPTSFVSLSIPVFLRSDNSRNTVLLFCCYCYFHLFIFVRSVCVCVHACECVFSFSLWGTLATTSPQIL